MPANLRLHRPQRSTTLIIGVIRESQPGEARVSTTRVVDLSQIAAGPYSTSLLGDMGADVIKVEPPDGDSFRHLDDAFGTGQSGYFFGVNRSKRSIALDLKSQDGYAVLARLVSTADIVIVAFRPGALKRLRVDYDTLRERTGVGDKISISLVDGLVAAFANYITVYDKLRVPFRRQGGSHPQIVPYQPFLGSDDKYFILACLNDKFWQMLLPMLDEYEDFREDRFLTNVGRIQDRDELCGRLQAIFATRPAGYWLEQLETVGVPCGPINELEDALQDPQVRANEAVTHLEHPVHGRYLVPNNPIRFKAAPTGPRGYAPGLGEHTFQILRELGYSPEEAERLFSVGAVRSVDHEWPADREIADHKDRDVTGEFTAAAQPGSLKSDH